MINMMIALTQMELIMQNDDKSLLFWLIYHVLLLLSLNNLNVYVIKICLVSFLKYYYKNDD